MRTIRFALAVMALLACVGCTHENDYLMARGTIYGRCNNDLSGVTTESMTPQEDGIVRVQITCTAYVPASWIKK